MRARHVALVVLIFGLVAAPAVMALSNPSASEVDDLLDRAEFLLRLGVVEQGATRAFDEASASLDTAVAQLAASDKTADERRRLTREIEAVQELLDFLTEYYQERFYGVFSLARLTVPTLLNNEAPSLTEQLYHSPQVAAIEVATRNFLVEINQHHHPHIVVRSSSGDRELENLILEILIRNGRTTPHTRRELIKVLTEQQLEAFDQGVSDPEFIGGLATALDAVNLFVLTIGTPVELEDATVISLRSDFFLPGEVISGSQVDASPDVRSESSDSLGFARDRRSQFRPIMVSQLLLLALAMALSLIHI